MKNPKIDQALWLLPHEGQQYCYSGRMRRGRKLLDEAIAARNDKEVAKLDKGLIVLQRRMNEAMEKYKRAAQDYILENGAPPEQIGLCECGMCIEARLENELIERECNLREAYLTLTLPHGDGDPLPLQYMADGKTEQARDLFLSFVNAQLAYKHICQKTGNDIRWNRLAEGKW